MSDRQFAIIDPAAGISGDMLLGALLASGASEEWIRGLPGRLGLDGVTVDVTAVDRCGVQAVKVTIKTPEGRSEAPDHSAPADSSQVGHGHRHLGQLLDVVRRAPVSAWVRDRALAVFRLLGEAEGRVHGIPAERVSLHEVGAVDALVDIIGTIEGLEQLGLGEVYSGPVPLGSGWVRTAHGILPVPAPATGILVQGLAIGPPGPVEGEATTPTGAALLRILSHGLPPTQWRAVRSGWGAGSRNPSGYPNVLRLFVAEPASEAAEVVVISADLDDLSPEYLEPLREALVAAGALDVETWATVMKKGRIGFRVEAVAPAGTESALADAFFTHSTTAGVRWIRARRHTLARREVSLDAGGGRTVRGKVLETPTGPRLKPEYDDVIEAARETGRSALEVAAAARAAGSRPAAPASDPGIAHKESP